MMQGGMLGPKGVYRIKVVLLFRGIKSIQYIFLEMIPSFLVGLVVFLLIILMFQVLRLTEFALIHGVSLWVIAEIILYICISMLPVLFPMSMLFAVILTYGRMSQDSEIVALRAAGLSMKTLVIPGLLLGALIALISAQTSFELAPWGNRQFEVLYSQMGNTKAAATIKAGTFSEGFFNMVVYANEVDTQSGRLRDVFIYDEKDRENPLTIISREGQIIPDPLFPGHSVLLRLSHGDIHRKGQNHTKIKFESYDIQLTDPIKKTTREKSPQSMTLEDLKNPKPPPKKTLTPEMMRVFQTEWHKRWAIAVLCIVFALIGVGLGTQIQKRSQKSNGLILSIAVIISYWVLYVICEGAARSGQSPVALSVWAPNILFGFLSLYLLRRVWD